MTIGPVKSTLVDLASMVATDISARDKANIYGHCTTQKFEAFYKQTRQHTAVTVKTTEIAEASSDG